LGAVLLRDRGSESQCSGLWRLNALLRSAFLVQLGFLGTSRSASLRIGLNGGVIGEVLSCASCVQNYAGRSISFLCMGIYVLAAEPGSAACVERGVSLLSFPLWPSGKSFPYIAAVPLISPILPHSSTPAFLSFFTLHILNIPFGAWCLLP